MGSATQITSVSVAGAGWTDNPFVVYESREGITKSYKFMPLTN